ncbi:hypothetical protein JRQ81_009903 [Phrynocephalus forsythii]|uniref:Uncharacterized protein n=1 Tax=Phrynocephalus forsythii TaxID=171643 RepID=A0A9Q0XAY1_9SAUR|nr:hypothetical protein JRQ81_009903 [Phrynocephalus forsythii]
MLWILFVLLFLLGTLGVFLRKERVPRVRNQGRNDRSRQGIPAILHAVFSFFLRGLPSICFKAQRLRRQCPRMRLKPHLRVTSSASVEASLNVLRHLALSAKEASKSSPQNPLALKNRKTRFWAGKEQERPGRPLTKKDLEKPWTPVPSQPPKKATWVPPNPSKHTTSRLPASPDPVRPGKRLRATNSSSELPHLNRSDRLFRLGHRRPCMEGDLLRSGAVTNTGGHNSTSIRERQHHYSPEFHPAGSARIARSPKSAPPNPLALGSIKDCFLAGKEQERPGWPLTKKDLEMLCMPDPSQAPRKATWVPPKPAKHTTSHEKPKIKERQHHYSSVLHPVGPTRIARSPKPAPPNPLALGSQKGCFLAGKEQERPGWPLTKKDLEKPWKLLLSQAPRKAIWVPPTCPRDTTSYLKVSPERVRPVDRPGATACPSELSHLTPWDHFLRLWLCAEEGWLKPGDHPTNRRPLIFPQSERPRYTYPTPRLPNHGPRVHRNVPQHNDHGPGSRGSPEPGDGPQHHGHEINTRSEEPDIPKNRLSEQSEEPQLDNYEGDTTTAQPPISESEVSDPCEGPELGDSEGHTTTMQPSISVNGHSDPCEGQ